MPEAVNYQNNRYKYWSISNSAVLLLLLVLTALTGGSEVMLPAVLASAAAGTVSLLYCVRPLDGPRRLPLKRADKLTLVRFGITGIIGLLIATAPPQRLTATGYAALGAGIVSVILDGFDGRIARKDGPTQFGSILDIEGDTYFLTVAIAAAVTRLQAPLWTVLLVFCRFLYVFVRYASGRLQPLPQWIRRPMQVNGVFGTIAVGTWYLALVPRAVAAFCLLAATAANIALFLVTCYLQNRRRSAGAKS